MFLKKKKNKYKAIKTTTDGIVFASKGEAERYGQLKILQSDGVISGLELQKRYKLEVNRQLICTYIADFVYMENGVQIVEDYKGAILPIFRMKAKLFKAIYGVDIRITGNNKIKAVKRKK